VKELAVTVGVFDGVHRGHMAILELLAREARWLGLGTAAITFDPHPDQVVRSKKVPLLTTIDERTKLLEECGVGEVKVLSFDGRLRDTPYEEFVRDYLVERMRCRFLVVGPNFALGRGRAGTASALSDLGARLGFDFRQAEPVIVEGRPVSSTWIRELVAAGDVEKAAELLGRPYSLTGKVVTGAGRGRKIGFPTANLELPPGKLSPGPGVYAGAVLFRGTVRPAAVNIGYRPTFKDDPVGKLTIEAHLLDLKADMVGAEVELRMVARLRDERHFANQEALAAQIRSDVEMVRRLVGPKELGR